MPHASSTHRNVHQSEQCLEGLCEHRADRCRQVDAHVHSVGLQLSPESFGTTGPCVGPVFPPVFLPLIWLWFANFTEPKSNPRGVPLSKPLQRLVFSRESLTLGLVPILGAVSPTSMSCAILLLYTPLNCCCNRDTWHSAWHVLCMMRVCMLSHELFATP